MSIFQSLSWLYQPSIIIPLSGGLGNQLFQYSFGRSLSLANSCPLYLDIHSGFYSDKFYKRSYQLSSFNIEYQLCPAMLIAYYKLYRLHRRYVSSLYSAEFPCFSNFITERNLCFDPSFLRSACNCPTWFLGYWQSPSYFAPFSRLILQELVPPLPQNPLFLRIHHKMDRNNSVALGIRLYEEALDPAFHALGRKTKSLTDFRQAVLRYTKDLASPVIYIFCSSMAKELYDLHLPYPVHFVTPFQGFEDPISTLWLLSKFKHHIFNNSSFYWWGAWLSSANYPQGSQVICASDNFLNVDSIPLGWTLF